MFDNVGTHNDEEATKRSFVSVLLTSLLLGAGAAFSVAFTTYQVVEALDSGVDPDEPIDVFVDLDPDDVAPPSLPPPPARAAQGIADAPEDDAPDEPADRVAPLEPPKTEIMDRGPTKGHPDGDPEGDPDSKNLGPPGKGDCQVNCLGSAGVGEDLTFFHHTELEGRRRVMPKYPEGVQGLGEQRCIAQVKMDQKGVPYSVTVRGCPKSFHPNTRDALLKWRWYPPKRGKLRVKASVQISVVFKD